MEEEVHPQLLRQRALPKISCCHMNVKDLKLRFTNHQRNWGTQKPLMMCLLLVHQKVPCAGILIVRQNRVAIKNRGGPLPAPLLDLQICHLAGVPDSAPLESLEKVHE